MEWDHFDDGSFATRDRLTLRLDPMVNADIETLSISVLPNDLPDDSPFRSKGTRLTFALAEPLDPEFHLAWGALENPTIVK